MREGNWTNLDRRVFLGLLFGIVGVALGDVRSGWKRLVRARSVQSNAAVDDQLRAGNVARIFRQQESCCPGHFVGRVESFQERLGGNRFLKRFLLVRSVRASTEILQSIAGP
jgi:hypothetical protein